MTYGLIERYRDRLPFAPEDPVVSLGEGSTPLILAERVSERLNRLFPDEPKREVRARGKAVADGDWGAEAVRKAVQDVQTAITASIVASTVVASGGS